MEYGSLGLAVNMISVFSVGHCLPFTILVRVSVYKYLSVCLLFLYFCELNVFITAERYVVCFFLFISAPLGKFPVAELLYVRVNDMLR